MQKYISKVENNKIVYHWNLIYDKETYINYYIQRNDQIKKYFSNRANDLLILDLSKEKNTEKLCNFLNIPIKFKFDFPHLNATKDE